MDNLYRELQHLISSSLLLQLALIVAATKLSGVISNKLDQPTVFGKLLIGIIIGPSLLGLIQPNEFIRGLAEVGVIVLMFLAGLETDVEEFKKVGYGATVSAVGGVLLPMGIGAWYAWQTGSSILVALFVGTVLTATSVSISAQTLRELGRLQSPVGMTILGAAVIDDVLGIVVLTLVLGIAGESAAAGAVGDTAAGVAVGAAAGGEFVATAIVIVKMAVFFVLSFTLGKKIIRPLLRWADKQPVTESLAAAALFFGLILAFLAEESGVANITGSYIAGLLIGMTKYKKQVTRQIETVGFTFLVPVFFVSIGLVAQVQSLGGSLQFVVILTLIAVFTKIVGCGLGAKISGFDFRDSLAIGTGMISRGEIALIIASIGLTRKLIDQPMYTAIVAMVLVSTIVTPPLLKLALRKGPEPRAGTNQ
jgi:Kef-type K+ transport system membrane component KefB